MIKLPHSLLMPSSVPVLTTPTLFYSVHPTMSIINSSAFRTLARIVLQSDSLAHSEPLFQQLHWLPIQSRIRFKLATITYKALSTNSPQYLASLIHYHQPVRSLRSCDRHYLLPHSIQYQLWLSLLPLLCSCHLEFNSS